MLGFFFLVVAVGFGLIAWRGDRLRSPGGIDAPLGREGAFLLNNLLFVGFAFVVLLGTLYPLLYQAITQQQVTVGAPYFNTVAVPVGLALLFLMAVAPVLSWRKINAAVFWERLSIPVWIGVLTVVVCVAFGLRGLAPLVGFGMGGVAAATAGRALVLSVRAARTRQTGFWRGLVGRTNGGMVVHLGVVVMAVGIIAATTYRHQTELALAPGQVVHFGGHSFEFEGLRTVASPSKQADQALVKVDGGGVFAPATTNFGGSLSTVGTPAIDSGAFGDVYLTFDAIGGVGNTSGNQPIANLPSGSVAIGVVIEPLLAWLWAGGLLIGLGGLLALVPGTRRRATDPASAPSAMVTGAGADPDATNGNGHHGRTDLGRRRRNRPTELMARSTRRRHTTRWIACGVLVVLGRRRRGVGHPDATGSNAGRQPIARPRCARPSPAPTCAPASTSPSSRSAVVTSSSTSLPAGVVPASRRRPTSWPSTTGRASFPRARSWSAWSSTMKWRRPVSS